MKRDDHLPPKPDAQAPAAQLFAQARLGRRWMPAMLLRPALKLELALGGLATLIR
jgi:hypothetical protein